MLNNKMKGSYRGYELRASKEKALGGWTDVYWSAYAILDGYELSCGFGGGSVMDCYNSLEKMVDTLLDDYNGDIEEFDKNER